MKRFFALSAAMLVLGTAFLNAGGSSEKAGSPAKVRKVVVGTGNDMNDFCFLDAKGNLVGLELDILSTVDELLPQYEFSFEGGEFRTILVGVDAGKYDIAAHNYAKNAERQEKYLYGAEPYLHYAYQLAIKAGRNDINSIQDMEGKTLSTTAGNNISYHFETYNATTAKVPVQLAYGALDTETQIKALEEGRIDAFVLEIRNFDKIRKTYNNRIQAAGPEFLPGYVYYIFAKGDTQLRDDVDKALITLRENGKLRELSLKWLGRDFTTFVPELEAERQGQVRTLTK
ncbi:MAG: transporter substrate-binding domain-containing protein [Treponema sp.]|jgi:L-cystine transport system substrate-binding protein|nr:transporter substrate-binding domain-containing protein [Treponema sp.]